MSDCKRVVVVKRPTIARNTSGFTRAEVMAALRVAGSRPSSSLLLDLTKCHRRTYRGWCRHFPRGWVSWRHDGVEYIADCHIRLRVAPEPTLEYYIRIKRGKHIRLQVTRWQALALLLAHEIGHWRQSYRDGRVRCLQIDADKSALRVARKLGLVEKGE